MMSIFSLVPFIIIAISAPVFALGDPGYYLYPSYYPPHNPPQQDSPPDRNDYLGGAKLDVLELHRPNNIIPTEARPPYAPPAYGPPAAYTPPTYHPPAVPMIPVRPHPVRPDEAYDFLPKTPTYKASGDIPAYQPPAENQAYKPPAEDKPSAETPAYSPPEETTTTTTGDYPTTTVTAPAATPASAPAEETTTMSPPPSTYEKPSPPRWGHGRPSPRPDYKDRRNAQRVRRQKVGKTTKSTSQREGPTRRLAFLKKRQQGGQHTVVPVTVDLIPGIGHAPSIGGVPTTTIDASPPSQSHFEPEVKVHTSQEALSLHSDPEATMQSVGAITPPVSSSGGHHQHVDLDTGEPRDKAAIIASILSIIIGLVVIITIIKLTSNVLRKRRHARMLEEYDEHLCSKEGLIPEMSDQAHFETHDVIITGPDGSEISPLSSSRENSPSPPPFVTRAVGGTPPPPPMPTFAPPPAPATLPYVKLLSPTVNLAQQNLMQSRASATSETMSMSTTSTSTSTDISERRSASDGEGLGRHLSHRRMR